MRTIPRPPATGIWTAGGAWRTHPDLHLCGLSELVRRYQYTGGGRYRQRGQRERRVEQPLHAQHQRVAGCWRRQRRRGQPDLYVSEFALDPATPVQGQPVSVRVGVYNRGTAAVSGSFHIAWFAGENYPSPACGWDLDGLVASGGRILTCTYAGYPSWYGAINTKVVVDTSNAISESDESTTSTRAASAWRNRRAELSLPPNSEVNGCPLYSTKGSIENGGTEAKIRSSLQARSAAATLRIVYGGCTGRFASIGE